MTRAEFIKRWRKAKCPRLYWKSANRRWRWDSDVIAKTTDHYFKTWAALEEFLTYCEWWNEREAKAKGEGK